MSFFARDIIPNPPSLWAVGFYVRAGAARRAREAIRLGHVRHAVDAVVPSLAAVTRRVLRNHLLRGAVDILARPEDIVGIGTATEGVAAHFILREDCAVAHGRATRRPHDRLSFLDDIVDDRAVIISNIPNRGKASRRPVSVNYASSAHDYNQTGRIEHRRYAF